MDNPVNLPVAAEHAEYIGFCQRRYDGVMEEADLMDTLANIAAENGHLRTAAVLRQGAKDTRNSVKKAADTVSNRIMRIETE